MVRLAVLVSGGGTNLQRLLDEFPDRSGINIVLVVSHRPEADALARAADRGVPTRVLNDHQDGNEILAALAASNIDAVVLAGYVKLVPPSVVNAYEGRIINIHPALLPAFGGPGMYGRRVHQAVLAAGVTISGPTVHLVSDAYDRGNILAQWPVAVLESDTAETLAARVLTAEHQLLPQVVHAITPDGHFRRVHPQNAHFTTCAGPPAMDHEPPD